MNNIANINDAQNGDLIASDDNPQQAVEQNYPIGPLALLKQHAGKRVTVTCRVCKKPWEITIGRRGYNRCRNCKNIYDSTGMATLLDQALNLLPSVQQPITAKMQTASKTLNCPPQAMANFKENNQ